MTGEPSGIALGVRRRGERFCGSEAVWDLAGGGAAFSVAPTLTVVPPAAGGGGRDERPMLEQRRDLVDLMGRVAAGDRDAFEDLYRATSAKLYGIVVGILVRRSLADEALQDVYARIWERAGDFDPARGSPIAWMAAVARNRALDDLRRAKASPVTAMPDGFDVASDAESALDAMEGNDRLRALMACLDRLDGEKREAVLLAYYRGCSRETLSRRYGRPVATIKTWLHRSLIQLRLCLRQ